MKSLQRVIKRLFDIVAAFAVAVMGIPLFALIALLVKLSSRGPVHFLQERLGRNEKVFLMLKFRTMTVAPGKQSTVWTSAEEARITRVGRFLRDFGLDELPQVWNILVGDMSVVGPRPPLPAQIENYPLELRRAFSVRPGVLSLAVIKGRRDITPARRVELHAEYVDQWSLLLDLKILIRSLFVVLFRSGASETPVDTGEGAEPKGD